MGARKEILDLAIEVSIRAGAYLKKRFYSKKKASRKKQSDEWSTPSDLESEELIRKFLSKRDSDSGVLGEEYGWTQPDASNWWCIDPLDGTSNFIRGIPYFSVSIAYMEKGMPTVGVVYDPIQQVFYCAQKGKKAYWMQGQTKKPLSPKNSSPLILHSLNMSSKGSVPGWGKKLLQTAKLRNFGSMALQLSSVAQGTIDYCVSDRAHLWDIAAGGLILRESGGKLLDFKQKELFPIQKTNFLDKSAAVVPFVAISRSRLK